MPIDVHPSPSALPPAAAASVPCRVHDADLWFGDTPDQVEHAKSLCHGCPLMAECLQAALRRAEPCGVWGGQLLVAGQIVARKRPRGRPRKVAA